MFNDVQSAAAFDEGGNFIQLHFSPLSLLEYGAEPDPADNTTYIDYHISAPSFAINTGGNVPAGLLSEDFDKDARPNGGFNDIGADEGGGPAPLADTDGDGISDVSDNCTLVANADQRDSNGDGFGNRCDPDFNGNGIVDPMDFSMIKPMLGQPGHPDQDLNGNGIVDPGDISITKSFLGKPPGPKGVIAP